MKITTNLLGKVAIAVLLVGAAISASAQETQPPPEPAVIERTIVMQGPEGPPLAHGDFTFISNEMRYEGKRVKGAPYSAQAVTESTQTLGDGNRIVRKSTATLYRDSEGRTRKEQALKAIGPLAADGEPVQTIFISDPVAGVDYSLDTRTRTARKMMPLRVKFEMGKPPQPGQKSDVIFERKIDRIHIEKGELDPKMGGGPVVMEWHGPREGNAKKESLGKQVIEGVEAEGSRSTVTIAAGEIGNERAIEVVSERWYSPELQTVVMTRHSDPRFGETTYRLTNISRTEPERSLFELPSGYAIKEDKVLPKMRYKKPAGEQ